MLFISGIACFPPTEDLYGKPIYNKLLMSMGPYQGTSYLKQCPPPKRTGETQELWGRLCQILFKSIVRIITPPSPLPKISISQNLHL